MDIRGFAMQMHFLSCQSFVALCEKLLPPLGSYLEMEGIVLLIRKKLVLKWYFSGVGPGF